MGKKNLVRLIGDKNQTVRVQQGERKVNGKMYKPNQSMVEIQLNRFVEENKIDAKM